MKLNLGCGKQILKGYINLDIVKQKGVDVIHDINKIPYPFKPDTFDEIFCNHSLEHTFYLPEVMKELHRISKKGCRIVVRAPYFACSGAFDNPEHKSFFTYKTFEYLQPYWGKFRTIKRSIKFSPYLPLKIFNPLFNIFPRFYERFLCFIIPCSEVYYILEVIK